MAKTNRKLVSHDLAVNFCDILSLSFVLVYLDLTCYVIGCPEVNKISYRTANFVQPSDAV